MERRINDERKLRTTTRRPFPDDDERSHLFIFVAKIAAGHRKGIRFRIEDSAESLAVMSTEIAIRKAKIIN